VFFRCSPLTSCQVSVSSFAQCVLNDYVDFARHLLDLQSLQGHRYSDHANQYCAEALSKIDAAAPDHGARIALTHGCGHGFFTCRISPSQYKNCGCDAPFGQPCTVRYRLFLRKRRPSLFTKTPSGACSAAQFRDAHAVIRPRIQFRAAGTLWTFGSWLAVRKPDALRPGGCPTHQTYSRPIRPMNSPPTTRRSIPGTFACLGTFVDRRHHRY